MEGGYTGWLLAIDLGREQLSVERYAETIAEDYLGGFGANNHLFKLFSNPGTDPFSPDNPIVLGTGPLVGTAVPGASRVMANSRLPLTGAVASASGGMGLGANMKWAGWDHLVLLGRAARPTVLRVEDDRVEFLPADVLWGMSTLETTRLLWGAYPGHSVLAIGPAGERMVHSSLAMIDACATLGRGGLAAVIGSKNLKALAIKGSGGVRVADPKRLMGLVRGLFDRLNAYPLRDAARELGMIGAWAMYVRQLLPHGASEEDLQAATERFGPGPTSALRRDE